MAQHHHDLVGDHILDFGPGEKQKLMLSGWLVLGWLQGSSRRPGCIEVPRGVLLQGVEWREEWLRTFQPRRQHRQQLQGL